MQAFKWKNANLQDGKETLAKGNFEEQALCQAEPLAKGSKGKGKGQGLAKGQGQGRGKTRLLALKDKEEEDEEQDPFFLLVLFKELQLEEALQNAKSRLSKMAKEETEHKLQALKKAQNKLKGLLLQKPSPLTLKKVLVECVTMCKQAKEEAEELKQLANKTASKASTSRCDANQHKHVWSVGQFQLPQSGTQGPVVDLENGVAGDAQQTLLVVVEDYEMEADPYDQVPTHLSQLGLVGFQETSARMLVLPEMQRLQYHVLGLEQKGAQRVCELLQLVVLELPAEACRRQQPPLFCLEQKVFALAVERQSLLVQLSKLFLYVLP
eukprot:s1422_g4.t1